MRRRITLDGKPLTLAGKSIKKGNKAPDFTVVSQDMKEVKLSDFAGKVKVITSFPSLDTPVCDLQVKEFNRRASSLSPEVVVIGMSKDLPFALKRFCLANDIKSILVHSDYRYSSFGKNYGLQIKELNLLARAVLIVDKNDVIRYIQIVPEIATPPDYEDAIKNLGEVLSAPELSPV